MTEPAMVERVARAMCAGFGAEWDRDMLRPEDYRCLARAAIAAMRKPTEAMQHAGLSAYTSDPNVPLKTVWQAMIDAALKEAGS